VIRAFGVALLLSLAAVACQTAPADGAARAVLKTVPLEIRASGRVHKFKVEVARSGEEQARGLMFRESLPRGTGMIFPFKPPRPASFWMKNTLIPLDMIFVRADGSIAMIAAETVPHSLQPVGTSEPVAAVLEIAGGEAARLGIVEDDKVVWKDR
jgi:uncharacterized protein